MTIAASGTDRVGSRQETDKRPISIITLVAMPSDPSKLRELAAWYREFAERAGNPTIWDGRKRTAEDLDAEADRIEQASSLGASQH